MSLTRAQQASLYFRRKQRRINASDLLTQIVADPTSPSVSVAATPGTVVCTLTLDPAYTNPVYSLTTNPDDVFQIVGDELQVLNTPAGQGYIASNTIDVMVDARYRAYGDVEQELTVTITLL